MTAPNVRTPAGGPASAEDQKPNAVIVQHADDARKAFAHAAAAGEQVQHDADDKIFRTLQAEAARQGCTLHRLACGGFLLGRWSLCKELPDLAAVRALLARMTGVRV